MRTSEFDKLAREQLRTLLPDFTLATGLVFEVPIADLLRGLSFQGSSYDQTSFYLVAFVQPLYIPRRGRTDLQRALTEIPGN